MTYRISCLEAARNQRLCAGAEDACKEIKNLESANELLEAVYEAAQEVAYNENHQLLMELRKALSAVQTRQEFRCCGSTNGTHLVGCLFLESADSRHTHEMSSKDKDILDKALRNSVTTVGEGHAND